MHAAAPATMNAAGSSPALSPGTQMHLANVAVSPAAGLDIAIRHLIITRFSRQFGVPFSAACGLNRDASLADYIDNMTPGFKRAMSPHFNHLLTAAAESETPYESLRDAGLIDRRLNYPDLMRNGLVTFDAAEYALAKAERDMLSILDIFRAGRYSRRSMTKRSAFYKLGHVTLVGLAAATVSSAPATLLAAGALGLLGIATIEGSTFLRARSDIRRDLIVQGRDIHNSFELPFALFHVRRQLRAVSAMAGDLSIE